MKTSQELLKYYLDRLGQTKLWPPLNNYSLFVFGSEYNSRKYFGQVYDRETSYDILSINDGTSTTAYIPEKCFYNYSAEVFAKYLKDQKVVKKIVAKIYENFEEVDEIYYTHTYDLIAQTDITELCQKVELIFDDIWYSNAWTHFCMYFDKEFCARIIKENNYALTPKQLDQIWDRAITPVTESFDKAQEKFALQCLAAGRSIDEMAEDCQYFFASYKEIQPLEIVRKKLHASYDDIQDAAMAQKKLDQNQAATEQLAIDYEAWLDTLIPEQQIVAQYCQLIITIRDARKNFFAKGHVFGWRVAERMFAKAGINPQCIQHVLIFQELIKGVDYIRSKKSDIEKRQFGYVALAPYTGGVEIAHEDAIAMKQEITDWYLRSESDKSITEIKGQIGSKGKVRGIVRIILDINRSSHFEDGEILVTGMTRPEFVPLMKKAAAIITDEGGITCHAAIVSRELKKPCIIGTKIATKILHDGDLVEVDADKGVIKIL